MQYLEHIGGPATHIPVRHPQLGSTGVQHSMGMVGRPQVRGPAKPRQQMFGELAEQSLLLQQSRHLAKYRWRMELNLWVILMVIEVDSIEF